MIDETGRRNRSLWVIFGSIGLLVLFSLCGVLFIGAFFLFNFNVGEPSTATSPAVLERSESQQVQPIPVATSVRVAPIQIPEEVEDYETAVLRAIYEKVSPSVVNVDVLTLGENMRENGSFFLPPDDDTPAIPQFQIDPESFFPQGQGSGFIWDAEGHIVTNAHVVENADQIQIGFLDGTITIAEVLGIDEHSDIAVLKIDPTGYNLVPVARGNLDDVYVGMRVAAIGNPFGFDGTMTSGIVSAIGRSIPALTSFSIPAAIQTDAVINPGNSGGPLLNERGEVIGVNAQIRVSQMSNTGIGFAIPIGIVDRVVPALIANGVYEHAYIGVSGTTYSPICSDALNLPKAVRGAYVSSVLSGTPAHRAGLRGGTNPSNTNLVGICPQSTGGDLITAIDDQPVSHFDDLLIYLERYASPGDTVTLTVLRDGKELAIDVILMARPDSPR